MNYEEMQEKVQAFEQELDAQRHSISNALEQAEQQLQELRLERDALALAGDVEQFSKKTAEVQLKEIALSKLRKQYDDYRHSTITSPEFEEMKKELFAYTNDLLSQKYKSIKTHLDAVSSILEEVRRISSDHGDVYVGIESMTYGSEEDTGLDINGIRYNRPVSVVHHIPDILESNMRENQMGNLRTVVNNLVEVGHYV